MQEILRNVRSILNKLTPQKFQTLMQEMLDLEINTEERLKGTIDLIFEKAIDEPNFSVAYANMCKCMIQVSVPDLFPMILYSRAMDVWQYVGP